MFDRVREINIFTCEYGIISWLKLETNLCISCIYMIDTASIMTDESRGVPSTLPSKTRSEVSSPPDLVPDTSSGDESDDEDAALTMSPAEIRVIRRLSTRTNVLPVIARADSLTDEKLLAVKNASEFLKIRFFFGT